MLTSSTLLFFFFFFFLFSSLSTSTLPQPSPTCNSSCKAFALLHTNPFFSSLSNLTLYLNLNRTSIVESNELPPGTELLEKGRSLLIPLSCNCSNGCFETQLVKTTVKGESFSSIAESLEGLTTVDGIRAKNPNVQQPWMVEERTRIFIPLRCACSESESLFFLTYPVLPGDSISSLSAKFNASPESIVSSNPLFPAKLVPFTSVLIPVAGRPCVFRRRRKMRRKVRIYVAVVCGVIVGAVAIAAGVFVALMQLKKRDKKNQIQGSEKQSKKQRSKDPDMELQQLSLSVRTTSDKKVSFESSQPDAVDLHPHLHSQIVEPYTPRQKKTALESYTAEEINRATEDFNPSNQIEGSVYHGRLNGKNVAIKRLKPEQSENIEFVILTDPAHHHPNILRALGTCLTEERSPDSSSSSYVVLEYANNGSLKDWLHGGLAMKNQFIASCYCFLNWEQRLKICLDVAVGLQYMHHIMNPSYVHGKIRSRNIFLDEEFNAKIGDFAMGKLVGEAGPADADDGGYLAPEYVDGGAVSPSADIFAYGVVLLEVLSGKTGDKVNGKQSVKLCESIKRVLDSEDGVELKEWIDGVLGDKYPLDVAVAAANLAWTCVEEDPSLRPSAGDIVEKLSALVEESSAREGGESSNILFCESSSKPLVKAAAP